MRKLITGFGGEYFQTPKDGNCGMVPKNEDSFLQGYKSVLNLKTTEESLVSTRASFFFFTLACKPLTYIYIAISSYPFLIHSNCIHVQANFARWEPGHGRFKFCHPWKQYLKIGALARQCAYQIETLNGHINSNVQVCIKSSHS